VGGYKRRMKNKENNKKNKQKPPTISKILHYNIGIKSYISQAFLPH